MSFAGNRPIAMGRPGQLAPKWLNLTRRKYVWCKMLRIIRIWSKICLGYSQSLVTSPKSKYWFVARISLTRTDAAKPTSDPSSATTFDYVLKPELGRGSLLLSRKRLRKNRPESYVLVTVWVGARQLRLVPTNWVINSKHTCPNTINTRKLATDSVSIAEK